MRLYLKNNDEFKSNVGPIATSDHEMIGQNIYCFESGPYLDTTDDFDVLKQIEILPKVFLKATIITFPGYSTNIYENRRCLGIYRFGKAQAELTPGQNTSYCLKIETLCWDGISDMKTLQEKLWAGTIAPSISYEEKQAKRHPFDILTQILDSRNLNKIQRFFLALRLTKQKK